eukprot:TRINITY_DN10299_c0_g1_i1.p1 TRINITY_DN10299_c0_g1~~TRINITY_DN10299_c0_g1_i1.p1  ORF type:complete len:212 (+),score=34.20 TRINITY_DN10299_c0_g1_i1:71-706(+)
MYNKKESPLSKNSCKEISPSPSVSPRATNTSEISFLFSSVTAYPSQSASTKALTSAPEIDPFPSVSTCLNTAVSSSLLIIPSVMLCCLQYWKMPNRNKLDQNTPFTRDFTINLKKRLHGQTFRKRAPRAIREIKKFAQVHTGTSDVRVHVSLNQHVWSKGIKRVPNKVRIRVSKQFNDDEEAAEEMYTLVSFVPVASFKGLQVETVTEIEE